MKVHELKKSIVEQTVFKRSIGIYCLGKYNENGFNVEYVGRSDTDLKRRLLQHVNAKKYSHFYFVPTETIFDAFRLECREWHRILNLRNQIHPDAPKSLPYKCPYCNASIEIRVGLKRWCT